MTRTGHGEPPPFTNPQTMNKAQYLGNLAARAAATILLRPALKTRAAAARRSDAAFEASLTAPNNTGNCHLRRRKNARPFNGGLPVAPRLRFLDLAARYIANRRQYRKPQPDNRPDRIFYTDEGLNSYTLVAPTKSEARAQLKKLRGVASTAGINLRLRRPAAA